MRRQDSNLRPPGYELQKVQFPLAFQGFFPLFYGKPGGHKSNKFCPIHCVIIPYGSKHGSAMWSCYGSAKQTAFTTEFGLMAHLKPIGVPFSAVCVAPVSSVFFRSEFRHHQQRKHIFSFFHFISHPFPSWVKNMGQAVFYHPRAEHTPLSRVA